ncbi:HNH endonuclease [Alloscardovia omnicolens]|uniref:HNH endonuclease signature motif containing protein n=1 Tax=Alloscardovia omnicolens TaxID=419015 RepID=UPI000665264B|nr:HNH endonuclease [Alloscardovia omnicolens]KWZ72352.1 HNH endonuclease domain protein [Alloscardovia omnicolens]MDK6327822.1 HNH endonuclease [Alloscardovia omnicolens]MDK8073201.1 HNH endonuclease [Alloscardovia omnicolens]MDK8081300.1 HNH endonuclease [Alloscardovia omnicolens]
MVSKGVSAKLARKVIAAYGNGCWLNFPGCTGRAETIDHVLPVAAHGPTILTNLRPACKHCNSSRKARMISGIGVTIHAVIGPPTAGKTTFVHENKNEPDIVLDYDALTAALLPSLTDGHNRPDYLVNTVTAMWASAYNRLVQLPQPTHIWLIKTLPLMPKSPKLLDEWIALNYTIHVIDPGKQIVVERMSHAARNKGAYNVMRAWYKLGITQDMIDQRTAQRCQQLEAYGIYVNAPILSTQAVSSRPVW